ncbi:MAG: hypothetical protein QM656_04220 [Paracoccaceae bacterium]
MTDLFLSQLIDPFRIGLIIALVATMRRTQGVSGTLVPLAAGVVFVAAIIPIAMQGGFDPIRVGIGILSNLVILAVVMAIWAAFLRLRG